MKMVEPIKGLRIYFDGNEQGKFVLKPMEEKPITKPVDKMTLQEFEDYCDYQIARAAVKGN